MHALGMTISTDCRATFSKRLAAFSRSAVLFCSTAPILRVLRGMSLDGTEYASSVDVLLAWLVERLGPKAVSRTAMVMAVGCAVATVAFFAGLLFLLFAR